MTGVRAKLSAIGVRRIVFSFFAIVALGLYFGLLQGWRNNVFLVSSWIGGVGALPPEFLEIGHRLHEFAFALLFWPFIFGLLAQFRSPTRHVTGMLMALVTFAAALLAFALTDFWDPVMILVFLGVPTALAALVHPAGLDLVRSFSVARINRVLLVLIVVASVPLLAFAAHQVGLQTGAIEPAGHDHGGGDHAEVHEDHIEFGHFTLSTAFAFAVIGVGLLSSFQQQGWWLGAWVAGLMVAVYALAGLFAPEAASNPGMLWNVVALAWAIAFIGAAEMTQDRETPTLLGSRRAGPRTT